MGVPRNGGHPSPKRQPPRTKPDTTRTIIGVHVPRRPSRRHRPRHQPRIPPAPSPGETNVRSMPCRPHRGRTRTVPAPHRRHPHLQHPRPMRHRRRIHTAHRNRSEPPCLPCKVAHSEAEHARYQRRRAGTTPKRAPNDTRHGTPGGYRKHIWLKNTPCQPCKDAHNADRRARKKANQ